MKFKAFLKEYKEDLRKKCVVLMGLPAAGKSTFIKNEIKKYIPDFHGYTVSNSDVQVVAAQFQTATDHYNFMQGIKNEADFNTFIASTTYVNNRREKVTLKLTFDEWNKLKDNGIKTYWKQTYKQYYATYFDIRDAAKKVAQSLFLDKIIRSSNILVIDTVAANPERIITDLKKTKTNEFSNIIIYLEIDPNLCIERDKYREKHHGRGVGVDVIMNYAENMGTSYESYKKEGANPDGYIDRLFHFKWIVTGNGPMDGEWKLLKDYRFHLSKDKNSTRTTKTSTEENPNEKK